MGGGFFMEVGSSRRPKHGQAAAGDVFLSHMVKAENRIVSVLADGLGSGVKANVLATLTSSMALRFIENYLPVERTADIILRTLPVCSERQIGYCTFTIVDIESDGSARIMEYGNPPFLLFRNGRRHEPPRRRLELKAGLQGDLCHSEFRAGINDRIVFFSDGVTQAGMGRDETPLGWGSEQAALAVERLLEVDPEVSARDVAEGLVAQACACDDGRATDDTTCAVIYCRKPRKLLMATGPPFDKDKDAVLAQTVDGFEGKKVVCGGTTAAIVARELGREVEMDLSSLADGVPPMSKLPGVDLVTEGTITLGQVAEALESGPALGPSKQDAVSRIVAALRDSDVIQMVVGTRVNEAHQDPSLPVELDIRRNVVKRIAKALEEKHLKKVSVQFV